MYLYHQANRMTLNRKIALFCEILAQVCTVKYCLLLFIAFSSYPKHQKAINSNIHEKIYILSSIYNFMLDPNVHKLVN